MLGMRRLYASLIYILSSRFEGKAVVELKETFCLHRFFNLDIAGNVNATLTKGQKYQDSRAALHDVRGT